MFNQMKSRFLSGKELKISPGTKILCIKLAITIFLFLFPHTAHSQSWSALNSGLGGDVRGLTTYGGNLIACGDFTSAGGNSANFIAGWNGSSWYSLGSGMIYIVHTLIVYEGDLFAGGSFTFAGGVNAKHVAKWNGNSWAQVGSGMNSYVLALTVYGGEMIAGGQFTEADGASALYIAKWNGTSWAPLSSGMNFRVHALTVYVGELIAGGSFITAGGVSAKYIARWNGSSWATLGSGLDSTVTTLFVHGGELIAGGYFTTAGGISADRIARWNGNTWAPLGSGMGGGNPFTYVSSLTGYGSDPLREASLIAGGNFITAGGVSANRIARWNGNSWASLGNGMGGGNPYTFVSALTVYGSDLIAGGSFITAGGVNANKIARWSTPLGIQTISNEVPGKFFLSQNYPNPFNPNTDIRYQLAVSSYTKLKVYDILGNEITILVNEKQNAGIYSVDFDASNYPSGIYYYKLETENYSDTKRMILLK